MSQFSDALAQLLTERGLSQNELGRRIGLSGTAISYWVTDKTVPSYGHVVRLEDELAVDPRGSLLLLAGYSTNSDEAPTPESLIRADPGLDPEDKRVILRIIMLARQRHTE